MVTAADRLRRITAGLSDALKSPAPRFCSFAEHADLSLETFLHSLRCSIRGWQRDEDLAAARPAPRSDPALAITPADTPAPFFNVTVAAVVRARPLVIKPSRARALLAEPWCDLIRSFVPECVLVIDPTPVLSAFETVLVFGSDETVGSLAGQGQGTYHGFGHRYSFATIDEDCDRDAAARSACSDIVAWEQQGCLSPHVFLVAGDADAWAQSLANEMERYAVSVPRAKPSPAASLAIHAARADALARGGRVLAPERGTAWSVLIDTERSVAPGPGCRTARVVQVSGFDDAERVWRPFAEHIETVGIAASEERYAAWSAMLPFETERLGWMQSPSLARRQSGLPSLLEIL